MSYEPVKENYNQQKSAVDLYIKLQKADPDILDALSRQDREIISIALDNLIKPDQKPISESKFSRAYENIQSKADRIGVFRKLWNAIENFFGVKTSPSKILEQELKIRNNFIRRDVILGEQEKLQKRLGELKLHVSDYENLKDMYLSMSGSLDNPKEAPEQLERIKEQIREDGILTNTDRFILTFTAPLESNSIVTQYIGNLITKSEAQKESILKEIRKTEQDLQALDAEKKQLVVFDLKLEEIDEVHM